MKTLVLDNPETLWIFTKAELVAILAHAGTDATREGQYGIALDVDRDWAHIYATDGHRGLRVVCKDRANQDLTVSRKVLVPRDLLDKAVKLAGRKDQIQIRPMGDEVEICPRSGEFLSGKLSTATPPPTARVLPQYEDKPRETAVAALNAHYLADVALVAAACECERTVRVRGKERVERYWPGVEVYAPPNELDATLVKCRSTCQQTEWTVAIMPVRR